MSKKDNWHLTGKQIRDVQEMAARGVSQRMISRITGYSRNTVAAHVGSMKNPPRRCPCGREYLHNGYCMERRKANGRGTDRSRKSR